jgi:hypothetical protein
MENADASDRRFAFWLRCAAALGAGAVLAVSGCFRPDGLPETVLCGFRRLTGLPCPGCGLTRSFCAISHGEFARAFEFNPFGYVFYALALCLIAWPVVAHFRPGFGERLLHSRAATVVPLVFVVLMMVYGTARIILQASHG